MSSHRADKHRAHKADCSAAKPSANPRQPGRRKSVRAPRRNPTASATSFIGGTAFLVAALGAATTGQAMSSDSTKATISASRHDGAYVARLSTAALQGRNEIQVSRSAPRLSLNLSKNTNLFAAAREQAAARKQVLATAGDDAETYADELARAERRAARQAERQAARQAERQAARQAERQAAREAAEAAETAETADDDSPTTITPTPAPTTSVIGGGWVLPTSSYSISTWFGEAGPYWSSGYHTGVDFAAAYGTPVVASTDATVVQTGWDGAYGNQIRIQIENGDQIWYNHLSSIEVTVGQTLSTGTPIGRVGETGNAYGAHLHLEYRLASNLGSAVDPTSYYSSQGIGF